MHRDYPGICWYINSVRLYLGEKAQQFETTYICMNIFIKIMQSLNAYINKIFHHVAILVNISISQ